MIRRGAIVLALADQPNVRARRGPRQCMQALPNAQPERFPAGAATTRRSTGGNMQSALSCVTRHFSAGIDITPSQIRMVVASRRLVAGADVRVEHLAARPLEAGVVDHVEILRPECVSQALSVLRDGIPAPIRRAAAGVRYAMALPPAATYVGMTSLAELARRTPGLTSARHACVAFDQLEPAVLAEAERLFRVDPASIVVDWLMADRDEDPDAVTIIAAPRDWLDTRIAAAAAVSITLSTVDGEAAAALRACRLHGALVLPAGCSWCAIWAGSGTVYAWLLRGTMVRREWHAPAGHRGPVLDALRAALVHDDLAGAVVAGDVAAIAAAGLDFDALRGALGCDPQLFRCAPFCHPSIAAQALCDSSAYAAGDVSRRAACAALLGDLRGYNLLPYRAWRRSWIRQRRAFGAACAALGGVGVAAVVATAVGRDDVAMEQRRQRLEQELAAVAAPIVEHAKLQAELGFYRAFCEQTTQRAVRRDQLLALLDRLSMAASHDVCLTELSRHSDETVIIGRTDSQHALSAWLDDLRHAQGVVSASVLSFRRAQPERDASDGATCAAAFDFTARLIHAGTQLSAPPHVERSAMLRAAAHVIHAEEPS
ncbi:hypothetical protein DFQ30_011301 [Apophysomyces sp. BC1015]|nr:hypothetical protein DFQ30_011301 [Apophysomyces sp. BC1015]